MLGSIQRTHTMAHLSEEERGCHSVGSERNKDCKGGGEGGDIRGRRLRCHGLLFPLHLIISQEEERKKARVERYSGHDLDGRKSIALFSLPPFVPWSVLQSFFPTLLFLFALSLSLSLDRPSHAFSCFLSLRQLFTRTELPKNIRDRIQNRGQ